MLHQHTRDLEQNMIYSLMIVKNECHSSKPRITYFQAWKIFSQEQTPRSSKQDEKRFHYQQQNI